jgi:hypothetical protein
LWSLRTGHAESHLQGESDPAKLADLAKGRVTDHHRFLLQQWPDLLGFLERKIALPEEQIVENSRPFEATVQTWMQVPGLQRINACSRPTGFVGGCLSGQPRERGETNEWQDT